LQEKISEIIRRVETNFNTGQTQISEHVNFSLKDTLNKIDAYINSIHTSGKFDTLQRPKPFFNIVTAARNIWMRATDIDRKNIRIKASKAEDYLLAFLASIHLSEWMKKGFGTFLNDWGRTLATYGSAIVKFVEKDGELSSEVIPWNRLIVDAVDFDANPVIEKLYLTPSQLRQSAYDQEMVEALIENSKTTRKIGAGQQKDNLSDFIEVYELHGKLPLSYLTDDEDDEKTYQQQMHVVSFSGQKGKNDDFTLYSGREKQNPYVITHLIKEDGRTLGIGAVEHLFEAQWMVNHTAKMIKDHLDLASKMFFQTADPNFLGKNNLFVETGAIFTHSQGNPLTQVNNKPDIVAMQSFGQQWEGIAKQISGTPEAVRGETMPSGTPYSLGALLSQQAGGLFELMTENKGLALEDMLRKFIIPHLKKKMDTSEEIAATLEGYQIKQLDKAFIPKEVIKQSNQKIKEDILSGRIAEQPDMMAIQSQIQGQLNETGNQRFIKPSEISTKKWKEVFKDLEWEVECEITNEAQDKQAVMQTLSTVLQTIAGNPMILQDPNARLIFNRILETAGNVSPIELNQAEATPQPQQPVAPVNGGQQMVGTGRLQPEPAM